MNDWTKYIHTKYYKNVPKKVRNIDLTVYTEVKQYKYKLWPKQLRTTRRQMDGTIKYYIYKE